MPVVGGRKAVLPGYRRNIRLSGRLGRTSKEVRPALRSIWRIGSGMTENSGLFKLAAAAKNIPFIAQYVHAAAACSVLGHHKYAAPNAGGQLWARLNLMDDIRTPAAVFGPSGPPTE
jgi:hypothetical protein